MKNHENPDIITDLVRMRHGGFDQTDPSNIRTVSQALSMLSYCGDTITLLGEAMETAPKALHNATYDAMSCERTRRG